MTNVVYLSTYKLRQTWQRLSDEERRRIIEVADRVFTKTKEKQNDSDEV